eukprot:8507103-Lingulodinium_polyedra.AAC.1
MALDSLPGPGVNTARRPPDCPKTGGAGEPSLSPESISTLRARGSFHRVSRSCFPLPSDGEDS